MSTTPRTDAKAQRILQEFGPNNGGRFAAMCDFARKQEERIAQLERELEEAQCKAVMLECGKYGVRHLSEQKMELEAQLTTHKSELVKAREALNPLAKIADAWHADNLDESRPSWGHNKEKASSMEIVGGRGGKQLLTIGDAFVANEALTAINEVLEAAAEQSAVQTKHLHWRCGICGAPAERGEHMIQCSAVPAHFADTTVGIWSDHSDPQPGFENRQEEKK